MAVGHIEASRHHIQRVDLLKAGKIHFGFPTQHDSIALRHGYELHLLIQQLSEVVNVPSRNDQFGETLARSAGTDVVRLRARRRHCNS